MELQRPAEPISKDVAAILHGHPYRAIIRLAWPAAASMLLETLFAVVDMIWVGQLGAVPLAAVISATFLVWFLMSLVMVLTTGVVAVVSRSLGAGDEQRAANVASDTWRFGLMFGVVITVLAVLFRHPIIGIMHLEPAVTELAIEYMTIYFSGAVFIVVFEWAGALFRASGDTRTPLIVFSIGIVFNMILDPFLIFGIEPFPQWGSAGAAWATVISYAISVVIFAFVFRHQSLPFPVNFQVSTPMDWRRLGRLLRIGLPISVMGMSFSVIYLFVNQVTARFGTEAVATLGIGNRIESIDYLVSSGFSLAVSTLVGQNLGARNPDRAASLTHKTIVLVTVFTGTMTAIYLLVPELLMRVFTNDPVVIDAGVSYVRILALSQIMMGWEIVLEGAFSGAGDTLPPMIVSVVGSSARIPLAWLLAVWWGWGIDGIWWTITISTIVKGIAIYIWFSLGRWKKSEV